MKDNSTPNTDNKNDSTKEKFNLKEEIISWIQILVIAALIAFVLN